MEVKWPLVRRSILMACTPILKLAGRFHTPPHYRSITREEAGVIYELGKAGDILLSRRDNEITNLIIPGFWKHAAMYDGNGRVIEAIGRGVVETSLEEFCRTKDSVVLLRASFANELDAGLALREAKYLRGLQYDYLVEFHSMRRVNVAFYCSEIGWWSYSRAMVRVGKESPFTPRVTMGVEAIIPQDYRNAKTKWDEIACLRGRGN